MMPKRIAPALTLLCALGCEKPAPPPADSASSVASTPPPASASTEVVRAPPEAAAAAPAVETSPYALNAAAFVTLGQRLSEPAGEFFSDNFISNETSFLQVAEKLDAEVPAGGVYVGVGPEQNFTYIATTEPELAFIVDIRRDNATLHHLYHALFIQSDHRRDFLARLLGRAVPETTPPADLDEMLSEVENLEKRSKDFERIHREAVAEVERLGLSLSRVDRQAMRTAHRAFYDGGLGIRFKLKQNTFRRYPSLRELITQTSPAGARRHFLADANSYRTLRIMQRENRIVPLTGDFGGKKAFAALGAYMTEKQLTLRSFYVSNVEQYLMVDGKWDQYRANVAGLPHDDKSVFIRAYLDQGRPHPQQMRGHRTASVLQRVQPFLASDKRPGSLLTLSSEGVL
ncbi:MAG: hypothetical protein AAGA56_31715 [Myxococcota bacterium]